MAEVETPPVEELERMLAVGVEPEKKEPIPCVVRYSAECKTPAIAWTFWKCPSHGRLRWGACLDHLMQTVEKCARDGDDKAWAHIGGNCGRTLRYLGHAEIG